MKTEFMRILTKSLYFIFETLNDKGIHSSHSIQKLIAKLEKQLPTWLCESLVDGLDPSVMNNS